MEDRSLDPSSISFGITDTIATSSQQLINDFLEEDGGVVKADPKEVKDINEPEPKKEIPKPSPKKEQKIEDEEQEEEVDLLETIKENEDDEPEPKKDVKQNEDEPEDFNAFEAFSKELYGLGVFEKDEDGEPIIPKSGEEFLQVFNEQLGKKAEETLENFLQKYGDDYREAFDAIFVKGVNPRDYYQTHNKIQNFQELDLSIESNQEKVISQALSDLGYDAEDISSEIERIKNYGDLEATAQKHHKVLVKKEQSQLQRLTEEKQEQQRLKLEEKQMYTNNVASILQDKLKNKEFDGIPLNPQLAKEVQEMLTVDKWKLPNGETLTDFDKEILDLKLPQNHALKTKVALILKTLKQDPTLSTIKKSGVTKQTNELFSTVVKHKPKSASVASKSPAWNNL